MPADTTFEQKFAQLAESQINEKLPSLMPRRVGFQVIDKSEDETQAVGIEAFVINGIWLYLPVFFLNGSIKLPALYVVQLDLFIPTMDNWISALVQRGADTLGWVRDRWKAGELPEARPGDVQVYLPYYGMSKLSNLEGDAGSLITAKQWEKLASTPLDKTFVGPDLQRDLLQLGKAAAQRFASTFLRRPTFANALFQFYDVGQLQKLAEACVKYAAPAMAAETPDQVRIITGIHDKEAAELTESQKKLLMRQGVYVKDTRTNFSKVFHEEIDPSVIENPTGPGIYDVLMRDGDFKTFIVLFPQLLNEPDSALKRDESNVGRRIALVDLDNPTNYCAAENKCLFGKPTRELKREQIVNVQGGKDADLTTLRGLQIGDGLLFVQNPARAIETHLTGFKTGADGRAMIMVKRSSGMGGYPLKPCHEEIAVEFSNAEGELRVDRGRLFVPAGCRVFVLKEFDEKTPMYGFGGPEDISALMLKKAGLKHRRLQVDGGLATLLLDKQAIGPMPKMDMLRHLMLRHGVYAGQALQLLKEASRRSDKTIGVFIKYAAPYDVAAYFPGQVPYMGGPSGVHPVPIRWETTQQQALGLTNPTASDGTSTLPDKAIEQAVRAAQAGIKEVFDVSVMKGLLEKGDLTELRRDYLADMIRGMDKVGRLLFLFYWHNEEFEDRYGKEDLRKLEDTLKQVFESLGDLILFLKEKTSTSPEVSSGLLGLLSEDVATARLGPSGGQELT